jgi:hypothetical protein
VKESKTETKCLSGRELERQSPAPQLQEARRRCIIEETASLEYGVPLAWIIVCHCSSPLLSFFVFFSVHIRVVKESRWFVHMFGFASAHADITAVRPEFRWHSDTARCESELISTREPSLTALRQKKRPRRLSRKVRRVQPFEKSSY